MAKRFRLVSEEEDDMVSTICTDSFNLANVLMLLSRGHATAAAAGGEATEGKPKVHDFPGAGRPQGSHKKPRMGGAATSAAAPEKPKVHECSVCGLEFAIGQALGGHMRRHRATAEANGSGQLGRPAMEKSSIQIDLNLPPLERGEVEEVRQLPKLLGFTLTPAMVDCFH
ncbi:hypothetical protein IEQ34_009829 [Dendrobium chrysotoxum]|uniref:C2H2-type domain-containing protein n=1 Tax=Dendrobium chrysotoxum TaxID=161865 RepID=A0AAV7GKD7_DENCH|nr:hypothetical protein IEQ34_009829 [Dendrobium chrysotoxum]